MGSQLRLYGEVFAIYLRLGCMAFGGPVAHLGYFREAFVGRRKWLSDEAFGELLALCQFIPGPSSSQLGFAIAWRRSGLLGACLAWLGFTLPAAVLMVSLAYGLFMIGPEFEAIRGGLLIATVAVVGHAVWSLGRKLCPDYSRLLIAILSAACISFIPTVWTSFVIICLAGLFRARRAERQDTEKEPRNSPAFDYKALGSGGFFLGLFTLLLGMALLLPKEGLIGLLAIHYQAGALVFGGGHVVLPLLYDGSVDAGYMTEEVFLSGYSAAQILPGPLFSFAAFLGTTGAGGVSESWLYGLATLLAIFLPGMLLLLGIYPIWNELKEQKWAKRALEGANAAVVGLLFAALIDPVWSHGIRTPIDLVIAGVAFVLIARYRVPAWVIVPVCGCLGYML